MEISEANALALLAEYVKEVNPAINNNYFDIKVTDYKAAKTILEADPRMQIEIIKASLKNPFADWNEGWRNTTVCRQMVIQLCKRTLPYSTDDVGYILHKLHAEGYMNQYPMQSLLRGLQRSVSKSVLGTFYADIQRLKIAASNWYGTAAEKRKLTALFDELGGSEQPEDFVVASDDWGTQANNDLQQLEASLKKPWISILRHAQTAEGSKPNQKWLEQARRRIEDLGGEQFQTLALQTLGFLQRFTAGAREETREHSYGNGQIYTYTLRYPYAVLNDTNANIIKGLIWCFCATYTNDDVIRMLGRVTEWSLKKVIGTGPRAPRVANAAVYVLGQVNTPLAISQLARLKTRVTFKTTLKEIEKALDAAAKKAGISKADLEEMGIPSFGLEPSGVRREMLGETRVELRVLGNEVTLSWFDGKDKQLKNPPASVKKDYAEDLKEFKAAQKDISGMLSSLSTRLDNLFLAQKNWPFKIWHERYLEHPLMGTIARRLIWNIDGKAVTGVDGKLVNLKDEALEFSDDATVTLWHPIQATLDDIVAWREWFERHRVTQPFKQAHREVYVLTDAEIRTRVYSNRFAAHILKQHQFNALCALRGWKNKLRLMVDDSYPPASLELPQWNLRVEFWIEGAGTNYGTDTNETGTYLYLSTDQVRFYQIGAPENSAHAGGGGYEMWLRHAAEPVQPLTLEQIPALVFSEVMRDVDMFVGVCSVGNDATWQDGGPQGRYRDYWTNYSFGELNATAETRKALLSKLIPRLKIADRCKLEGRFLWVRGDMRSYKIHLGSSNILMEPNDQYLCIVPSQSSEAVGGKVFLPFEGDRMLSVILSKAFLLAEDTKIADTTITRQIKSGNWN